MTSPGGTLDEVLGRFADETSFMGFHFHASPQACRIIPRNPIEHATISRHVKPITLVLH
jgi:hypothetical protein